MFSFQMHVRPHPLCSHSAVSCDTKILLYYFFPCNYNDTMIIKTCHTILCPHHIMDITKTNLHCMPESGDRHLDNNIISNVAQCAIKLQNI